MRLIQYILTLTAAFSISASAVEISDLRCEYRANPLGIDAGKPRLSWIITSAQRGERQTAYHLLVASTPELLAKNQGDLWDSGRVESAQSIQLEYAGKALNSRQLCFWKVQVWDRQGKPSAWSQPALWTMGLLNSADWQGAQWIGLEVAKDPTATKPDEERRLPARYLRREFQVDKKVAHAVVSVCGLGLFELHLNGAKVGDSVLSPGLTDYDKRCYYVTYDVTRQLGKGANALGVILGNGRFWALRTKVPAPMRIFGELRLLLELTIDYTDGSHAVVCSDESWRLTEQGPIRANNEYDGEEYEAQLEFNGWDKPGFGDSAWSKAQVLPAPKGVLAAQMAEPIRVIETLPTRSVTNPKPGVYVFDLGQNMVGWCRLKVKGQAGTMVTLRHAETLGPDGMLYTANLRSAKATDRYTLKGGAPEVYEPRFTYHGFRFVEVTGYPGKPELSALEGCVVHDDLPRSGSFTCSNPLLNQIAHNILWGIRGNYRSIVTDCPQRDERMPWLGDRAAECRGEASLFNIAPIYSKWFTDISDSQRPDGALPDVAPAYWSFYSNNVTWPSLAIIAPGTLYDEYGDLRVLQQNYPMMKKWMQLMSRTLKDGVTGADRYGDWCVPPEAPNLVHSKDLTRKTAGPLLATSYHFNNLRLMARYAALLGFQQDAQEFGQQADAVMASFNARFYKSDLGQYDNGTQTSSILPLAFGLVPEDQKSRVVEQLVDKIKQTPGQIGTGLIGGQWLMRTLCDQGRPDLAYALATRTEYPSLGYMAGKGATTIWELWNGNTANPSMNSGNHVMLIGDTYSNSLSS